MFELVLFTALRYVFTVTGENFMKKIEEIEKGLQELTLRENEFIEFKTRIPWDKKLIAKQFVGIANNGGGYYIIGVKETEKGIELIGVKEKISFITSELISICNEYTTNVKCDVNVKNINNYSIIIAVITISEAIAYFKSEKPIVYLRDSSGRTSFSKYEKVYKYMPLEAFILNLCHGNWRFFEPSKWSDNFESRFYCANFSPDKSQYAPKLYATCVTRKQNNEAAWKVYAHGHGLGAHCVQLELDIKKLRAELNKSIAKYEFAERKVKYEHDGYILNLHKNTNPEYPNYFMPFSLNKFISLLSLKRDAYEYENEIRIFAIPLKKTYMRNIRKQAEYIDFKISWKDVIRRGRIDKSCSEAEIISIQQACFQAGINPLFKNSRYKNLLPSPSSCIDIEFELFSIDDDPESSGVIIVK